MKKWLLIFLNSIITYLNLSCNNNGNAPVNEKATDTPEKGSFAYDAAFLKKHLKNMITLESEDGKAQVIVTGDYQGRVMTSTANGDHGNSFGWINYNLIASGVLNKQFNPVGGEERFWLGPEGGQYALYFKGGDSFNINHWQVPALIDTDSFAVRQWGKTTASFNKQATLKNYSGTIFEMDIERTITLLTRAMLEQRLEMPMPEAVDFVAYESKNRIKNIGKADWNAAQGLPSIWLLGMFTPSAATRVIIPYNKTKNTTDYITTNYFGEIPASRIELRDSVLIFTCDGNYRSKIGISPAIAKPVAGSFDFSKQVLTVILFSVEKEGNYVNSKWEMQQEPYNGDVVNAYNDGPLQDGSQLGPFYELESSSSAAALKKGGSQEYIQVTCHFSGAYGGLKTLAQQLLGVDLDQLKKELLID